MIRLLDSKKLEVVREIAAAYAKQYKDTKDEAVNWLDNNLTIFFEGFAVDLKDDSDWKAMTEKLAEKAPYLKASSFESIFAFMMTRKISELRRFLKKQRECFSGDSKACEYIDKRGGGNKYSALEDFAKIRPENAVAAKRALKAFAKSKYMEESSDVYYLCESIGEHFSIDASTFDYSDRVSVGDVWKATMFLLSQRPSDLVKYVDSLSRRKI